MRGDVKLRYCKVGDEIHFVSDFAHLAPKQRPFSICPECELPLTLKLGSSGKVAHHAAHQSDNKLCSLTNPESALHFNTKMYICDELKKGNKLFLKQSCAGWTLPFTRAGQTEIKRPCFSQKFNKYLWLENWDDVQIEKAVSATRPDIVLYRESKPIGAIEIFVTHAVDENKKAILKDAGVQWAEVKAEGESFDESFVDWAEEYADEFDEFSWKIDKPLAYENCFPMAESWTCESCLKAPEQFAERQAAAEEKERLEKLAIINERRAEETRQRKYTNQFDNKVLFAKAILFLRRLAESEYVELFVVRRDNSEPPYKSEELYLKLGKYGGKILISEEPITDNSKEEIKQFFRDWLLVKSRGAQEVVHITNWIEESEFDRLTANYANPYAWHPVLRKWVFKE